jgi:hypothetical protein
MAHHGTRGRCNTVAHRALVAFGANPRAAALSEVFRQLKTVRGTKYSRPQAASVGSGCIMTWASILALSCDDQNHGQRRCTLYVRGRQYQQQVSKE